MDTKPEKKKAFIAPSQVQMMQHRERAAAKASLVTAAKKSKVELAR